MQSITEIPEKNQFTDALSNSTEQITDQQYLTFCTMWQLTGVTNLLELIWIYNQLDTTLLADTLGYLWNEIWKLTSLSPVHFFTIAR